MNQDNYAEILANRILSLCKANNYSVTQLAKMSDLGQSTLDSIVRASTKNPGIQTIHHIAYGFGMTLLEFLDIPELNTYSFE